MVSWLDGYFQNKQVAKIATYDGTYIRGSDGNIAVTDILQRTHSSVRVALVEPAATFTSATPSSAAAGADTLLTSAGVHGLTGAVSVGASIYISAGAGWTVGFHTITAIAVDTTGTAIQVDTPYNGSMVAPTIALANTEVTVATIAIPVLGVNSYIAIDWSNSNTTSGNNKAFRVKYGGTTFLTLNNSTTISGRSSSLISNRGSTNSQLGGLAVGSTVGFGTSSVATATGAVNSSISQDLVFTVQPSVANEVVAHDRHIVSVWR